MSAVPQAFREISINQTKGEHTLQSVLTNFNEPPVIARRDKFISQISVIDKGKRDINFTSSISWFIDSVPVHFNFSSRSNYR